MTGFGLVIVFVIAIVAMILMISKLKIHPFISIMLVALAFGLIGGIPLIDTVGEDGVVTQGIANVIGAGFSSIFTSIGIVIILGALIGSVLGVLIGFQLFPRVIVSAYSMMYHLPRTVAPFHWGMAAAAVGSAVVIVCLTVSSCCYAVMRERPAGLMRPKAPGKGKRVLLERVGFIWKRCSFSWKVSLRNLFRYKKRMFMAVVGIAGCTALLLTGVGLNDSISDIVTNQYDRVWTYQALAVLDDLDENTVAALTDTVRAADPNGGLLPVYQRSSRMEAEEKALDVSLFVVEDTAALSDFVSLHGRTDLQTPYDPADGAVLTEKAATLLGVTAGDALSVPTGPFRATFWRIDR